MYILFLKFLPETQQEFPPNRCWMLNAKRITKGRFTNLAVTPCFEWAIQLHNALRRKPAPADPKVNLKKPQKQPNPPLLTGFGVHSGGRVHSLSMMKYVWQCWITAAWAGF